MKVQATLKNLRIAPRKVRLVTRSIVGVDVREAVLQLSKNVKKSGIPIEKLLKSALANAINNCGLDEANLYILEIRVGDGLRLKRWLPRAFGRATPLLRRGSNVTVILEEKIEGKDRKVVKSKTEKVILPDTEIADEEKDEKNLQAKPPIEKKKDRDISKKTVNRGPAKKVFQRKAI